MVGQKYVEWFRAGAVTYRALMEKCGRADLFPTDEDWYPCPICFDLFTVDELLDTENGLLSLEHVPPDRLGGGHLVITCRRCNNDQGSRFDADAAEQERLRKFFSGQSERPERSTYTVGGIATNVNVHIAGNGVLIVGDPQRNNPANTTATEAYMNRISESHTTDFRFTVTPKLRFSPDHARVSWIRSAYLAAFAVFGWQYILQLPFVELRGQLLDVATVSLPILGMYDPDGDDDRREIWLVKDPTEHRSVFVVMGKRAVFLPTPFDSRSLMDLSVSLGANIGGRAAHSFTGDLYDWPPGPMHLLDNDRYWPSGPLALREAGPPTLS